MDASTARMRIVSCPYRLSDVWELISPLELVWDMVGEVADGNGWILTSRTDPYEEP